MRPLDSKPTLRPWDISIHAPLAGCDPTIYDRHAALEISIHAPLAGCDAAACGNSPQLAAISIHAPLAGCDATINSFAAFSFDFNPRTPCGVRQSVYVTACPNKHFNPRTPCGVRQVIHTEQQVECQFQSTHPLRGATRPYHASKKPTVYFNPRTPCGVRR